MILIVGLGNIGARYANTRHNVGFLILDQIVKLEDSSFAHSIKMRAFLAKVRIFDKNILLAKPDTLMNRSGSSVSVLSMNYKPEKILVIHDELDLPFGKIKYKLGGSDNGHNGLKSITQIIGPKYYRIRFGISRPEKTDSSESLISDYVLSNFNDSEKNLILKDSITSIYKILSEILES